MHFAQNHPISLKGIILYLSINCLVWKKKKRFDKWGDSLLKSFNKAQGIDQATTKNHREYGVKQRINASTFNNICFLKFFCTSLGYHKTFQATNFLFMYLGIYYSNLLFHVEFIKLPLKLLNARLQLQFFDSGFS